MKLTILGCFSAFPNKNSFTSSQLLEINGKSFLIDCGEGTQIQLRRYGIKLNSIENIFISHLHGDHFFGLPCPPCKIVITSPINSSLDLILDKASS